MRLRSRPLLFAQILVDCATTRPLLRALLEQRRAADEQERAQVADAAAITHSLRAAA